MVVTQLIDAWPQIGPKSETLWRSQRHLSAILYLERLRVIENTQCPASALAVLIFVAYTT